MVWICNSMLVYGSSTVCHLGNCFSRLKSPTVSQVSLFSMDICHIACVLTAGFMWISLKTTPRTGKHLSRLYCDY